VKIFPGPILWKDPIGWAQGVVGINFWSLVFIQVFAGAATVYVWIRGTIPLYFVLVIVVLFIIYFPFYYLFVIRKLVLELKKLERSQEGKGE
jgi:hypothetical protein